MRGSGGGPGLGDSGVTCVKRMHQVSYVLGASVPRWRREYNSCWRRKKESSPSPGASGLVSS